MIAQAVLWGTGLLFAVAGAFLAGRGRSGWSLAMVAVLPPVLLLGCFVAAREPGDFRLRFEGLSIEDAALADPVRIGGDAERDDLVFDRLPGGLLRLISDPGYPTFVAFTAPPPASVEPGLVESRLAATSVCLAHSRSALGTGYASISVTSQGRVNSGFAPMKVGSSR